MTGTEFDVKYSVLRREVIDKEFSFLNPMQKSAVLNAKGPQLILAGAGSGKTTVLIQKIVYLIKFGDAYFCETAPKDATDDDMRTIVRFLSGDESAKKEAERLCEVDPVPPWQIIAITFTNKAAKEIKERLSKAVGEKAEDIWAQTFHSACVRILRRDIEKIGYSRDFTIYDEDDKKKVLTECFKELNIDPQRFEMRAISSAIGKAKDALIDPFEYEKTCGDDFYKSVILKVYKLYQKKLSAANALDFDDIIFKTVELLKQHPDICEYYQQKFKYVLVDEYQDTNYAQYVLTSLLAGGYRNICVVGDDDQSIYKFRGATIRNILDFEKTYPDAKTIRLEQNYRSTQMILDAANAVIKNNVGRKGKTLWTDNGEGVKTVRYQAENQEDEAQFISNTILKGYSNSWKFGDFAVLYRNHVLSNSVESAFKRNGIPYRIVSGVRFFDRAEVKDMLAYLWVIQNHTDTLRLRRIINNPPRKIGDRTLETAQQLSERENVSVFEIIRNADKYPELSRARDQLVNFSDMIEKASELSEFLPLDEFYSELLDMTGYVNMLENKDDVESAVKMENIFELKSNIIDYMNRVEEPTLQGFLEEVSLFTDIDRYDENADAVVMMTMHSAKGLEFPNVFLCGMEEGIFPSFMSMEKEEDIEEERRICYVAMTRAKKNLYLTHAARRMIYGRTMFSTVSRFISEIPEEIVDTLGTPAPPEQYGRYAGTGYVNFNAGRKLHKDTDFESDLGTMRGNGGGYHYTSRGNVTLKLKTSLIDTEKTEKKHIKCDYEVGMSVLHTAFGKGRIKAVTRMGGDALVEVEFEQTGVKRLMAGFAARYMKIIDA